MLGYILDVNQSERIELHRISSSRRRDQSCLWHRYDDGKGGVVMVEIKPTEAATVRYAIRTAMGQLLDYEQRQLWPGRRLIVVENPVTGADDSSLGFGKRIRFGMAGGRPRLWVAAPWLAEIAQLHHVRDATTSCESTDK